MYIIFILIIRKDNDEQNFYGTSISTKNNPDFGQLISIMAVNWFAVFLIDHI